MSKDSGLDLVAVLARDHRALEWMLGELERIPQSGQDKRGHTAAAVARELVLHQEVESQCLYGVVRKFIANGDDLVERDEQVGLEAAQILDALQGAESHTGRLDQLIERLAALIRDHTERQEKESFAGLSKHADRSDLEQLGDRVHAVKMARSTRSPTAH